LESVQGIGRYRVCTNRGSGVGDKLPVPTAELRLSVIFPLPLPAHPAATLPAHARSTHTTLHEFVETVISRTMASKSNKDEALTLDNLESQLAKDTRIKLAGVDIDGKRTFS
jgi:hypothetical protein